LPRIIDDAALERMNRAAAHLVGKQDFAAYMAQGSTVATTVRTVKAASVEREGNLLIFRISADGFLYNMVRILTGTMIDVGLGKIDPEDIPNITASRDRSRAGMTVPACGLYLNRVLY
jgi:tRNA pseudouridine38-40 synthase